jgi:hypothetical protein
MRNGNGQANLMDIEDMSGCKLDQAMELLNENGIVKISVKLTASPRLRDIGYDSNSRVVRQVLQDDGTMELLVCNLNI